ncbi:MAG: rRNA pseudouridine synthase [Eubacterium sp.]|nr:rRNA pseudouridine synthase [Eubacterium sp.]
MILRLDKYLADTGFGTRSTVKQMIRKGQVQIDGAVVKSSDVKLDTGKSVVTVNGKTVSYEEFEYYMLNKPAGVISASTDEREKTVVDLISEKKRRDLFPVGRLDRDTVGLLLITNDGALSQKLLAPGKHVDKVYLVRVTGELTEEDVRAFEEGMDIGDEKLTKPAKMDILGPKEAEVTLTEGRFHQIKRMFEARGHEVVYLKRLSMGSLKLDESLAEGEYRKLTDEELNNLKG